MKDDYVEIMESGTDLLLKAIKPHLEAIKKNLIAQTMYNYELYTDEEKYLATDGLDYPAELYKKFTTDLEEVMAIIALEAITDAMDEVVISVVTLAEPTLPTSFKRRLAKQSTLLADTTIADLTKQVSLAYSMNWKVGPGVSDIMAESADAYIDSVLVGRGMSVLSAELVNESRFDVFQSPEGDKQVTAWQFYNPDPVTNICSELNGQIFSEDDPNFENFSPPLHYNCKSTYLPIRELGPDEEVGELTASSAAQDEIQF